MEFIVFFSFNPHSERFEASESGGCKKKSGLAFFHGGLKLGFFGISQKSFKHNYFSYFLYGQH